MQTHIISDPTHSKKRKTGKSLLISLILLLSEIIISGQQVKAQGGGWAPNRDVIWESNLQIYMAAMTEVGFGGDAATLKKLIADGKVEISTTTEDLAQWECGVSGDGKLILGLELVDPIRFANTNPNSWPHGGLIDGNPPQRRDLTGVPEGFSDIGSIDVTKAPFASDWKYTYSAYLIHELCHKEKHSCLAIKTANTAFSLCIGVNTVEMEAWERQKFYLNEARKKVVKDNPKNLQDLLNSIDASIHECDGRINYYGKNDETGRLEETPSGDCLCYTGSSGVKWFSVPFRGTFAETWNKGFGNQLSPVRPVIDGRLNLTVTLDSTAITQGYITHNGLIIGSKPGGFNYPDLQMNCDYNTLVSLLRKGTTVAEVNKLLAAKKFDWQRKHYLLEGTALSGSLGYFFPTDKDISKSYGNSMMYSLGITYPLADVVYLSLLMSGSKLQYSRDFGTSQLSHSLSISMYTLSINYYQNLPRTCLFPHLGIGAGPAGIKTSDETGYIDPHTGEVISMTSKETKSTYNIRFTAGMDYRFSGRLSVFADLIYISSPVNQWDLELHGFSVQGGIKVLIL